ncbi:right-handed parallel beta-helix repeat-containing protein [Saccharothrix texasensis]|uniref:Parallel beta helix pectate lyase-like protein n=1 Tax=Saccharothrix texasensis TaxID=103734 RepID=A0A3N1H6Z5_9PSEU|nr:right-handed parallel beta-helix repeat-containing protein [Saccharothrix texasensis]ROP38278.1 parallel beta helix pectate lyase-like protein [Saccharothrix texasensis]
MTDFHVSPSGDDATPGTAERPFATLARARQAAREVDGDVTVHLRAGTHVLTEPLDLTEEDSRVVYQAFGYGTAAQEEAVVSGGREVAGRRGPDGVWRAEVGDLVTRHLVVDGRRVERAGVDGLPGTVRRTATGYATDAPLDWRSPAGVEFVHRGVYPWTEARTAVASVHDGEITMAQPAFGWAVDVYNSEWFGQVMSGPPAPTRVENDPAFLTEGTFALDRSRPGGHVVHYLPRPGEEPRVVVPALEVLVRATGVRDVAFRGVVFADTTWLRPGGDRGFLHYHSNGYYDGGRIGRVEPAEGAWLTVPEEQEQIPAGVQVDGSTGVRFEGCRFTRLGAAGLGATGGADLVVRGCDFDTLAASAISVTGTNGAVIEDNLVADVGLDHSGSAGITFHDTADCAVAHNHVRDVPHNGIVAHPSRGGTRITRNLVTGTMGVLADGGGIYLSGAQGTSEHGAVISGNVIEDTRTPYNFGLYTDYGATWVTVEGNVVARADNTAVLHVHPPLEHVVYRGNFWDADPVGSDAVPDGVTYEGNTTIADPAGLDTATAGIRAAAGLLTRRA